MRRILPWLIVLLMLLVVFTTVYSVVQQAQRRAANLPQIQLAQDTAAALDRGDVPSVLVHGNVNINKSLAPFTIIYDKQGKPVAGSGQLDGKLPKVDIGVLANSKGKDYNAVTWEPKDGVRIASVSVEADKYYVLSGRSLKEVEKNESHTLLIAASGFVITILLYGLIFVLNIRPTENY